MEKALQARGFLWLDGCSVALCRPVVRWRDGSGRQRGKRFASEDAAREFDQALGELAPRER